MTNKSFLIRYFNDLKIENTQTQKTTAKQPINSSELQEELLKSKLNNNILTPKAIKLLMDNVKHALKYKNIYPSNKNYTLLVDMLFTDCFEKWHLYDFNSDAFNYFRTLVVNNLGSKISQIEDKNIISLEDYLECRL